MICLNVGGRKFTTTAKTLQRIPGSYLDKLVKGEVPISKDQEGNIFLDQNGSVFEYVLDYLRDGEIIYPDNDKQKQKQNGKYNVNKTPQIYIYIYYHNIYPGCN